MREHLLGYDPESFSHLWQHPDPLMDRLHVEIAAVVAADADASIRPRSTHATIRRLTADAATEAGLKWADAGAALPPEQDAPPRLSEPWFCCAEPTTAQLAGAGVRLGA